MKQSIAQIGVFYFAMVLKMAFGGFQLLIFLHSSLKSNDIVIPSPLDTNMSASSGYRRMGGWGKRDELMNGYKRLHS